MTTLFLIRHGLTAQTGANLYGRTRGIPLDERGRRRPTTSPNGSARSSSPRSTRARWSGACKRSNRWRRRQRLPIQERDGLMEMDVGAWTGRSLKSLRRTKRWGEIQRSPSTFRFPDGEAFAEALERIEGEIRVDRQAAPARSRGGGHPRRHRSDARRALHGRARWMPFQRTVIDTAGVSVVSLHKGSPHVHLVNDTGGLDRFGPAGTPPPWEVVADPDEPAREPDRLIAMELGPVDRITADAIGEPGDRAFYLQARAGD